MEKYDRILVCLDQSPLDVEIIRAADRICELSPREIIFINVIRDFTIPEEMLKEFPHFMEQALDERRSQIKSSVLTHFKHTELHFQIEVVQGDSPAKAILQFANGKQIDLIIAGRKKKSTSSGVLMSRLARRSDCSFLMIAEGKPFDFTRILVPVDFSEHSALAIMKALDFANLSSTPEKVEIFAQNVYTVPSGYHTTGKTHKEFAEIMKENAMKSYEAFIKGIDLAGKKIKPIYSLNDNDEFVSDIREQAKRHKTDLIIIGARGQTATSMLFLGSKAERIVMMHTGASMLVVRRRGDKAGFRDLLQEL